MQSWKNRVQYISQRSSLNPLGLILLGLAAFGGTYALVRVWQTFQPRAETPLKPAGASPGMVWIPGGEFTMGTDSELGWSEEHPAHRVDVEGFWIDETEVTNAQFRVFVEATDYVTTAERPPDVDEILSQSPPGTPPPAGIRHSWAIALGRLDHGLDEAPKRGWTVVSMEDDWKAIFPSGK